MDSMNDGELDHVDGAKLFKSHNERYDRIAHGAGVSIQDVKNLIQQYSNFSKLMKGLGGKYCVLINFIRY